MSKKDRIINPFTEEPLSQEAHKAVKEARQARAGARKAARSGHPGRRAEALRALDGIPQYIHQVYVQEAQKA